MENREVVRHKTGQWKRFVTRVPPFLLPSAVKRNRVTPEEPSKTPPTLCPDIWKYSWQGHAERDFSWVGNSFADRAPRTETNPKFRPALPSSFSLHKTDGYAFSPKGCRGGASQDSPGRRAKHEEDPVGDFPLAGTSGRNDGQGGTIMGNYTSPRVKGRDAAHVPVLDGGAV
ncbi:hypothetical protein KM043_009295 [Ampulex compressa]|nr:hypothetical protein KM043_009295 [Ampulex compressa]